MQKLLLASLLALFVASASFAQNVAWVKHIGGNGADIAVSTAIDQSGNIYTYGYFAGEHDFDPGPGVFLLDAFNGIENVFFQKMDASGKFIWAVSIFDGQAVVPTDISVDENGFIYATGYFSDAVDFDPGPLQTILTSPGIHEFDIFIIKFTSAGEFVWVKQMGGTDDDKGRSIQVDPSGNIYTVGEFQGTVDFDPGPGVTNMVSTASSEDIFIQKLNSDGQFVWAKRIGSFYTDAANAIDLDNQGSLYVTGKYKGNMDFDPGPGTLPLSSANLDVFVLKMDTAGQTLWANRMGGVSDDQGTGISVDPGGNVLVTGEFQLSSYYGDTNNGTGDLDAIGGTDVFVLKVNEAGTLVWAKQMGGLNDDQGKAIDTDQEGKVYTTGYFYGVADFDPGTDDLTLVSAGGWDIFIQKLSAEGELISVSRTGGIGVDEGNDLQIDPDGNIVTVGAFNFSADFDPGGGITNLISKGGNDIFIRKTDYLWDFQGTVFNDLNANQMQDPDEPALPNLIVESLHPSHYTSTDVTGHYHFYSDIRGDTLQVALTKPFWISTPPYAIPDSAQTVMNFAITVPDSIVDVGITVTETTPFRAGFTTEVLIQVSNYGAAVDSLPVHFDILQQFPSLEYISAVPSPWYVVGDSIGWIIPKLGVLEVATIRLKLRTPPWGSIPLNTLLFLHGAVPVAGDIATSDNTARTPTRIVGSHDPNDKQVIPENLPVTQIDSTGLNYVIRFQNTGNYQADFVVLLDTLAPGLDLSTLRLTNSSHPCTWQLYESRLLEIRFDDIFLPDSTSNEPGSHGFAAFSVRPEKGLQIGDSISNKASIYFDFNEAIVTNEAVMRVTPLSGLRELLKMNRLAFGLYPNPAASQGTVRLELQANEAGAASVQVYDMQGKLLRQLVVPPGEREISLTALPSGTYIVKLQDRETELGARLLVVE